MKEVEEYPAVLKNKKEIVISLIKHALLAKNMWLSCENISRNNLNIEIRLNRGMYEVFAVSFLSRYKWSAKVFHVLYVMIKDTCN